MSGTHSLKTLVLVISSLLLLGLLGSCASPAATTGQATQSGQALGGTAPASQAASTKDNSIVILIPEDPPSFNPVIGDTGYDALVMNLVMLGLTGVDPKGNIYPELAAELPTIDNGDVKVDDANNNMDVTWKLRKDITWSDGTPVTANDAVFTWNAINDPKTGTWVRGRDYVDSIEKIDDYTFVFHYNTIYPNYLVQLGGDQLTLWPAHYCNKDQGYVAWECARKPLSNGPFMLQDWVVGDHMTFVRNPKYYEKGKPALDKITVRVVPDEAVRKTMMIQGDADLLMWAYEPILAEFEKYPDKIKISRSDTSRWVMRLFPNEAAKGTTDPKQSPHPIFNDVRIRRAVRMAVDVDTIYQKLFLGYGKPIWSEFYREPYTCDISRPKYDPEAAKALLDEAGWKDTDGDGIRECHGCANAKEGDLMKIDFYTYAEYGETLNLTQQYIAENLKSIGIDAKLTVYEGSVLWADPQSDGIEQNGKFDLDLWDDGYAGVDPTDFLREIYSPDSATPGNGWNIVRWDNADFSKLLDEAYTLDETKRKEVFCQIARLLDDQVPVILLFSTVNADAYSSRLENIQTNVNDIVSWNAADWKLAK